MRYVRYSVVLLLRDFCRPSSFFVCAGNHTLPTYATSTACVERAWKQPNYPILLIPLVSIIPKLSIFTMWMREPRVRETPSSDSSVFPEAVYVGKLLYLPPITLAQHVVPLSSLLAVTAQVNFSNMHLGSLGIRGWSKAHTLAVIKMH